MVVGWNQGLSHFGEEYFGWLKRLLCCHWKAPKPLVLKVRIAVVHVADAVDVGLDSHIHELLVHCGRRVEAVGVAVEERIQRSERLVRQLV